MPELPGEPRLRRSEGCRACGGGAIGQKDFLEFLIVGRCAFPLFVDSGAVQVRPPVPEQLVARLPFWRSWHLICMRTTMSDEKVDLCDDCGPALSEFLNEMAEQNGKVATCPKCGKIHDFPPKTAKRGARS